MYWARKPLNSILLLIPLLMVYTLVLIGMDLYTKEGANHCGYHNQENTGAKPGGGNLTGIVVSCIPLVKYLDRSNEPYKGANAIHQIGSCRKVAPHFRVGLVDARRSILRPKGNTQHQTGHTHTSIGKEFSCINFHSALFHTPPFLFFRITHESRLPLKGPSFKGPGSARIHPPIQTRTISSALRRMEHISSHWVTITFVKGSLYSDTLRAGYFFKITCKE